LCTKPKTAPECTQYMEEVEKALRKAPSVFINTQMMESAFVSLKGLRKKRCKKAINYIVQLSEEKSNTSFARKIHRDAVKYLDELNQL
jgi:hypothetical protein